MKLDYIEMAGFRGFRTKTRLTFPRGFAVITGRNGVGKSTAFDAIDFALTGSIGKYDVRVAKGGGLEDHIWWVGDGQAAEHYVSVGFASDSGERVSVTRNRDGSVDAALLSLLATHLCQDMATSSSWQETLIATSLIRDERISALSLDLTEQARFSAVRAALGASDVSIYEDRAKEVSKLARSAREEQTQKHSRAHEELGRALSALTEARSTAAQQIDLIAAQNLLRTSMATSETDILKLTNDAKSFLAKERQAIVSIRSLLAAAERLARDETSSGPSHEVHELAQVVSSQQTLSSRLETAQTELVAAESAFDQARAADEHAAAHLALLDQGEKIGLENGHCPLCQAERSVDDYFAAIEAARLMLSRQTPVASAAAAALSKAKENVSSLTSELNSIVANIASLESAIERRKEDVRKLGDDFASFDLGTVDNMAGATQTFIRRQEAVSTIEQCLFALDASRSQDRVVTLEGRVEQLRAVVESEAMRVSQTDRSVEIAQQTEKAIKQVANELLGEQFDTVLPLLKELYRRLRPHADWREIEIDIAGQVRASLNFTVGDGHNPQFLFSSGQRRAAGLAFLLAVHLSRPWCALNTLMLDDPIQHIDDYRSLNLVEVLSSIRQSGRQVVIAVEDKALADVLCRRLRSSVNEPGVRYELGTDDSGSATIHGESVVAPFTDMVLGIAEAS